MGLPISPTKIYGKRNLYKQIMSDGPISPLVGWEGYFHNTDPTVLKPNALTFPSKNCFIPNKDKIVPRLGKTLLGQGFSQEDVAISADSFSEDEELAGVVTEESTPITGNPALAGSQDNSSVQIDDTHFLLFYRGSDGHGYAQVFFADPVTKLASPAFAAFEFETGDNLHNSCAKINSDHYINFWGTGIGGKAQVFDINPLTYQVLNISVPLALDAVDANHNSCVKVDGNHFLNFWTNGTIGKAQVVEVNIGTYVVTAVGAPLAYDAAVSSYNSCGQVDASHYINFWTTAGVAAKARVFNVNLGTFAVTTAGALLTVDAGTTNYNSCVNIDASHFQNFWQTATVGGKTQVFEINLGTFAITGLSTALVFDAAQGQYNSCAKLDATHIINFWEGAGNKGNAQVFSPNVSTGAIEALASPLVFTALFAGGFVDSNFFDGKNVLTFWVGSSQELTAAIFSVNLTIGNMAFEHACSGDNRILWVGVLTHDSTSGDKITGVAYAGVPMTLSGKVALDGNRERYLYYLLAPEEGINTVLVSSNGIDRKLNAGAESYFGVKQVAPSIMSTVGPNAAADSVSITETPVVDNSWMVALFSAGDDYSGGVRRDYPIDALDSALDFDTLSAAGGKYIKKLSDTRFVMVWARSLTAKMAQVFDLDRETGVITALSAALAFYTDSIDWAGAPPSIEVYDSTHFTVIWTGKDFDGFVQSFQINATTGAVTAWGAQLEFDPVDAEYISSAAIDPRHILVTWTGSLVKGRAQIFTLNPTTGDITLEGTPFAFASVGQFNSVAKVSDTKAVVFFADNPGNGDGLTLNIDTDLWAITSFIPALEFYTNAGNSDSGNDVLMMNNRLPVNLFMKLNLGKFIRSTNLNNDTWLLTNLGSEKELTTAGTSQQNGTRCIQKVDPTHFIVFFKDTVNGLAELYEINLTTGELSLVSTVTIDTNYIDPAGEDMGDGIFLNAWRGAANHAFVQAFSVEKDPTTTLRGGNDFFQMADSGSPISPAAPFTMRANFSPATTVVALAAAFAPAGGDPAPKSWPIVGHKKRYTNDGGYTMEVRITRTGDAALRDVLEALLANPLTGVKEWYQITENVNPLPVGVGERYYMDTFFDTNLNPAISRRNSRLVWVTGIKTIFSWAGGVNPITSIVPGVSITGAVGKSWISQGFPVFTSIPGQSTYIVVKGKKYLVTSGWDTDTLLLSDTEGISVGDMATAWIAPAGSAVVMQDTINLPSSYPDFDYCRQNKNYMFYGSFSSRQLFMSNNFNRAPVETVTAASSFIYLDDLGLPATPDFSGSAVVVYTITIDGNTPDSFKWTYTANGVTHNGDSAVVITPGVNQVLSSPVGDISIVFGNTSGHVVGDAWKVTASPSVGDANYLGDVATPPAWANFFYNLPRIPGQGYIFFLPANFWAMEPQETEMYVNDQYGQWSTISTQIAADLQSETISFDPLKQLSGAKVIFPYMISHMENEIVFVTENKNLEFIARKQFLELPQMDYLSQPVAKDFEAASFAGGSMEYLNKRLYITSPEESMMLVYDNQAGTKYWQPPQTYSENGILSIVENILISHSNLRNQTFNLFTGKSDNGSAFTVVMRTPYLSFGDRWRMKNSNKSFLEGYIGGLPPLFFRAIQGIGGCAGVFEHEVQPVICAGSSIAPLGEGSLGSHPNGSDLPDESLNHFNEIFPKYNPILQYYFLAFELSCATKNHSYEVLSMGVNELVSNTGNSALIPEEKISRT